jgi:hypothetical protein
MITIAAVTARNSNGRLLADCGNRCSTWHAELFAGARDLKAEVRHQARGRPQTTVPGPVFEERPHQRCDLVDCFVQYKVTGVQDMDLRIWDLALIDIGAVNDKGARGGDSSRRAAPWPLRTKLDPGESCPHRPSGLSKRLGEPPRLGLSLHRK